MILLWVASAWAQCTWITGATVHTPTGVAVSDVVLAGDRIAAVGDGPGIWKGETCEKVDASGAVLTPGLVESSIGLGVVEIGLEPSSSDVDAERGELVRASVRIWDAYNPASTLIPVARRGGVTSAVVRPTGGLVSGQAAWVALRGEHQSETLIRPSVAVYADFLALGSRAEALVRLRDLFDQARRYSTQKATWSNELVHPDGVSLADLEALAPVLRREIPLVIAVNRASDMEALLRFGAEQKIRLVFEGGAEGWKLADALAASKTAVILDPYVYGPGSFDEVHGRPDNAAILEKAGVPVVISTFSSHNARLLPQAAGNAVRGGMSPEGALQAITATPAEVFQMADRGRIVVGAQADLVLWSGDPLELSSAVRVVWIAGERMSLESRQTKLRDKYLEVVK